MDAKEFFKNMGSDLKKFWVLVKTKWPGWKTKANNLYVFTKKFFVKNPTPGGPLPSPGVPSIVPPAPAPTPATSSFFSSFITWMMWLVIATVVIGGLCLLYYQIVRVSAFSLVLALLGLAVSLLLLQQKGWKPALITFVIIEGLMFFLPGLARGGIQLLPTVGWIIATVAIGALVYGIIRWAKVPVESALMKIGIAIGISAVFSTLTYVVGDERGLSASEIFVIVRYQLLAIFIFAFIWALLTLKAAKWALFITMFLLTTVAVNHLNRQPNRLTSRQPQVTPMNRQWQFGIQQHDKDDNPLPWGAMNYYRASVVQWDNQKIVVKVTWLDADAQTTVCTMTWDRAVDPNYGTFCYNDGPVRGKWCLYKTDPWVAPDAQSRYGGEFIRGGKKLIISLAAVQYRY